MPEEQTTQGNESHSDGSLESRISTAIANLPGGFEIPLPAYGLNEGPEDEPADYEGSEDTEPEGTLEQERPDKPSGEQQIAADSSEPAERAESQEQDLETTRLAALAEAERDARRLQNRLKSLETDLSARAKALEERERSSTSFAQELQRDPFGTLARAGVNFDSLLDAALNNPQAVRAASQNVQPAANRQAPQNDEIQQLRNQIQQLTQTIEQRDVQSNEQAYKNNIHAVLQQDDFSLLNSMPGAEDAIFGLAIDNAQQNGQILPPSEIAATLQEEWAKTIKALPENKKALQVLKEIFGNSLNLDNLDEAKEAKQKQPQKPQKRGNQSVSSEGDVGTLTNNMGSAPTNLGATKKRTQSRDEVLRMAARMVPTEIWGELEEDDY